MIMIILVFLFVKCFDISMLNSSHIIKNYEYHFSRLKALKSIEPQE